MGEQELKLDFRGSEEFPEEAYDESNEQGFSYIIELIMKHKRLSKVFGVLYYNYSRPLQYYVAYAILSGCLDYLFGTIFVFSIFSLIICAEYAYVFDWRDQVYERCAIEIVFQNENAKEYSEVPLEKEDFDSIFMFNGPDKSDYISFTRRLAVFRIEYIRICIIHIIIVAINYYFIL
jgi:hypothetical protein